MFAEITKGVRIKRNLAFATFPVLGPFRNDSILTLLILAFWNYKFSGGGEPLYFVYLLDPP